MTGPGKGKGPRASGYSVGYGRPPEHARFVKGRSGNPKGRPRGAKNRGTELQPDLFREVFLSEGLREITLQEGGRAVSVPMLTAAIRKIYVDALKGRPRAQELILRQAAEFGARDEALVSAYQQAMIEYKVEAERELDRRARAGIANVSDLIPHPEDIRVDFQTGEVTLHGPMSNEEKALAEEARGTLARLREGLAAITESLRTASGKRQKQMLETLAAKVREQIAEIEAALP